MQQSGDAGCTRQLAGLVKSPEELPDAIRTELAGRLRARRREIETVILARIDDLGDPVAGSDPAYAAGLHSAVAGAVRYGVEGIEKGGESSLPVPPTVVRQARRAARAGVSLDLVLRCHATGNKALEEFILVETEGIPSRVLGRVLAEQAPHADRLLALVADEYKDEHTRSARSPSRRRADRIARLAQDDSPLGPADLDYDFDSWHVALILRGPSTELAVQTWAERLGRRLLHAVRDEETTWAWLSSARQPSARKLERFLVDNMPAEVSAAIGEPRFGLDGWRLSHREAKVALQAMLQAPQRLVRGRNVVLRVGVMRDETLSRSLLDGYLTPLKRHANAQKLLEALRAYLITGGNAAAAAAAIGVTRHTVQRRIRAVEETLGRPLYSCHAELHVALQIDELEA
ncbi:MAG TPA: helix-turn-helix domain-containing protein [Solirubrobacterales bacterium]|nr:helix-turn-helix domain-containing protein [Solirubrobacterales bacterium]